MRESEFRYFIRRMENQHPCTVMGLAFREAGAVSCLAAMRERRHLAGLVRTVSSACERGLGLAKPGWKVIRGGKRGKRSRKGAVPRVQSARR